MRRWLFVALASCGRIGFDQVTLPGDGSASADAQLCSVLSPPDWLASKMNREAPRQYTVSADGTAITDHVTGLRWQREVAPGLYLPTDAAAYCDALALDGCDHWRLPQRIELATLVDHRFMSPVSEPPFGTPIDRPFATASLDPNNAVSWIINFDNGNTFFSTPSETFHVRCVHSEVAPRVPPARYEVGPISVLDLDTGLVWLDAYEPSSDTQMGGTNYCISQRVAGGRMWRLPEIGELETLIDRSRTAPAVDPVALPGTPSTVVWSSSIFGVAGMIIDFTTGNVVNEDPTVLHDVRCVD